LPLLMSPIVKAVPIQIGPWVLGALLVVIVRRAARSPAARGPVANEESAGRGETVQPGRALNDHPVTP
jgi:hypothetical protein